MKVCKNCGKKYGDEHKFCQLCGCQLENYRKTGNKKLWVSLLVGVSVFVLLGGSVFVAHTIQEKKKEELQKEAELREKREEKKEKEEREKQKAQEKREQELEEKLKEKEAELEEAKKELEESQKKFGMSDIINVSATSVLSEKGMTHSTQRIIDGDEKTAWVEGVKGQGENEAVSFSFNGEYKITGFSIKAGYHKSAKLYDENSRPANIRVTYSDGSSEEYYLEDLFCEQNIYLNSPKVTRSITLTILSVYPGSRFEDTVISELKFY